MGEGGGGGPGHTSPSSVFLVVLRFCSLRCCPVTVLVSCNEQFSLSINSSRRKLLCFLPKKNVIPL